MNGDGRCAVFGAAVGYSMEQIEPFVRSLQLTGYSGDIVLLVGPDVAESAKDSASFAGVTLLGQRQWWPVRHRLFWGRRQWALRWIWRPIQFALWVVLQPARRLRSGRLATAIAMRLMPPTETRYLRFLDLIAEGRHSRILLSDVRDVLFQADPFTQLPADGLALGMEVPAHTVSKQVHTANWVREGYGQVMLDRLADDQVSCSGVTAGDRASMLDYLSKMRNEILLLNRSACASSGMDQGIHNVLLWNGRLQNVTKLETSSSTIATLGGNTEEEILVRDGLVVNADGSLPSIVHQYDRFPSVREALLERLERAT